MTGAVIPPIYATSHLQAGRRRRAARRLRVQPLGQPHAHRPRGQPRGAGGGGARLRVRLRPGRRGHPGPGAVPARRPRGDPRRRVRRHVPALRQGRAGLGPRRTAPAPVSDVDAVRAAIRPGQTRLVWVETPTNPLLNIGDIEALAAVAHDAGALLVVDNTFASPYLQQPLTLGADVVVHSTTKYCGGHSDVVGGALVVRDLELAEQVDVPPERHRRGGRPVRRLARAARAQDARRCGWTGTATTPSGSWSSSAGHPPSTEVIYPGLEEHPGHAVASRQMKRFGGIVASGSPAASSRRSRCASGPRSSPSASRSAASSR